MKLNFQVLILSIISRNVVTSLVKRHHRFMKIVAHVDTLPRFSDVMSQHRNVSSLSQCGIKCSGELGCCSFFYSETAQHCLTASSVHQPDLTSAPGYNHLSIHGEVITEGLCFDNSLYFVGPTKEKWTDAEVLCTLKGAKLVEIQSEEENKFLQVISRDIAETVWIGGTDNVVEGLWTWMDNSEAVSFTAWGEKQPNNYHDQDCLSLFDEFDFLWADEDCSTKYKYICEKKVPII